MQDQIINHNEVFISKKVPMKFKFFIVLEINVTSVKMKGQIYNLISSKPNTIGNICHNKRNRNKPTNKMSLKVISLWKFYNRKKTITYRIEIKKDCEKLDYSMIILEIKPIKLV